MRGPGGPGAVAGCVLLRVQAAACGITEEDLKAPYAGFAPDPQSDGWVISTPEAEGMDRDAIEDVYVELFSDSLHPTAHSLLIVRHGFPGGGSLHP